MSTNQTDPRDRVVAMLSHMAANPDLPEGDVALSLAVLIDHVAHHFDAIPEPILAGFITPMAMLFRELGDVAMQSRSAIGRAKNDK